MIYVTRNLSQQEIKTKGVIKLIFKRLLLKLIREGSIQSNEKLYKQSVCSMDGSLLAGLYMIYG